MHSFQFFLNVQINTLYVGNLPTSPPPNGFPQDYLEDTLREIFSARPGYRKLCFRQKSNGPMCFVEVGLFGCFVCTSHTEFFNI